ncbi:OmpH family outer membrane protein [Candidatus Synchoanobacter obligatus]|uniref:OmpH family outer membrane protein n=1 Tax=Candidatus Synchoanobacter obligatus TaxID=2919597 RepID=A0ABT1L4I6_9GAMM|nr:OmpH family outer membrane protein [Candidatus Synchoanobacter obligatus]MCP8352089.1 OmpH family outer membrane protein [Candidatus Synchoanobacter obligatus]
MKRFFSSAVLASLLSLSTLTSAESVAIKQFHIAYIDLEEVFSSQVISNKIDSLREDFESRHTDFEAAKKRLEQMQVDLEKDAPTMTDIVRENREREIREMATKLSQQGSEMSGEYYSRQQEIKSNYMNQVSEISEKLAKKYKIQVVYPKQALLYVDSDFSLTEECIRSLK